MDMNQTLNAQLAMPMLGMMLARRTQRREIKFFMPKSEHARGTDTTRMGGWI